MALPGLGTRVGGRYVHGLTDHGDLVREVLIKGADAVLFEATNPMPVAPVMLFLAPGEEEPHDDFTFTAETRTCAGAYAGVHPLTAKGSKVHDYLAIAPLLPSILPGRAHHDG